MIGSPCSLDIYMIHVYIFACIVFRLGELDLSHKLDLPDI